MRLLYPSMLLAIAVQYPAHWFAPVTDTHKPDWEILPQAAKPGEVILSKRNELGILSNFAATPFVYRGVRYASLEGFWQMMLYPEGADDPRARVQSVLWPHTRAEVMRMTAFEAKAAGDAGERNMGKLGIDWVTFEGKRMPYRSMTKGRHYRLIVEAMRAKLEQNPRVRDVLVSTGNLSLLPDHIQEAHAPPEWAYNRIWMQIRAEVSQKRPQRKPFVQINTVETLAPRHLPQRYDSTSLRSPHSRRKASRVRVTAPFPTALADWPGVMRPFPLTGFKRVCRAPASEPASDQILETSAGMTPRDRRSLATPLRKPYNCTCVGSCVDSRSGTCLHQPCAPCSKNSHWQGM